MQYLEATISNLRSAKTKINLGGVQKLKLKAISGEVQKLKAISGGVHDGSQTEM